MKYHKLSTKPIEREKSTGLEQAMDGEICCESTLGQGVTFVIEFSQED